MEDPKARLFETESAAREIGEAMQQHAFQLLYEMLAGYEERILKQGIDDPELSKDYLRGFVHGVRALRADMQAAREYVKMASAKEDWQKANPLKQTSPFLPPGAGPGGLS